MEILSVVIGIYMMICVVRMYLGHTVEPGRAAIMVSGMSAVELGVLKLRRKVDAGDWIK